MFCLKLLFALLLSFGMVKSNHIANKHEKSGPIIPDPECGKTKGCFNDCDSGDCTFQLTWKESGDYISFNLSQNIDDNRFSDIEDKWIALGISDNQEMTNTSVIMCKNIKGKFSVELGYCPGYQYVTVTKNTSDLLPLRTAIVEKVFICNFKRLKVIKNFKNTLSLTDKRYVMVGYGDVDSTSGIVEVHMYDSVTSPDKENFINISSDTDSAKDVPIASYVNSIVSDSHKRCYRENGINFPFVTQWIEDGEYISFNISLTINATDNTWIALGISDDQSMKDTSVMMCKNVNGTFSVELGYNPGYSYTTVATNTSDLVYNGASIVDGIFTCAFKRLKTITDYNNTFSLLDQHFVIVGYGHVDLTSGTPQKHPVTPFVGNDKQDFINSPPILPDPECGITKGCFREGCEDGRCLFQVTWQEDGDYISFAMSQKLTASGNKWIALGISDDQSMKDTSVIMCKEVNGTVTTELGYNPGYFYNTVATNTSDLVYKSGSNVDGVFTCAFKRRKTLTSYNDTFSLIDKHFVIVGWGIVEEFSGTPQMHKVTPVASAKKQDFFISGAIVPDPECGISKGCFHNCGNGGSCVFQVIWEDDGDYISFTISQKIFTSENNWIALGISDDQSMADTSVIMCKDINGTIFIELGYNPGYQYTTVATNTSDLVYKSGSNVDGIFTCAFKRLKTITNYNNTFSLIDKHFLIVAYGDLKSGIPMQHKDTPVVSPEKHQFINSGPIIPDQECGKTLGCFYTCNDAGDCAFRVVWHEDGDYINFGMAQNISAFENKWIALGISDDQSMADTSVIMCKNINGTISIELGYNPGYRYTTVATNTSDVVPMDGSVVDGVFRCNFKRLKTITDFNNTFSLIEKRFLIVGYGDVDVTTGIPQHHSNDPVASAEKQDFINIAPDVTTSINPSDITTNINPGDITTASSTQIMKDSNCGKTLGCFYSCANSDGSCTFLVTWKNLQDTIKFDIMSVVTAGIDNWIAIGIGSAPQMVGSSVMMCIMNDGQVTTELGFNHDNPKSYSALPNKTFGLYDESGSVDDGIMKCSFQRKKNITDDPKVYDLDEEWYLLFAHGQANKGTPLIHTEQPKISDSKVSFLKTGNIAPGKQSSTLVKVHGSLMIIAWIVLSTSGMLTARYFKQIFNKKVNDLHLWFQIHRGCMCTVVLLTTIALIIIFVEVGGFSKISVPDNVSYVKYHPILGLVVTGLMFTNPIMAFFRCGHTSPYRKIFNWLHWGVAVLAQISAGFNIGFSFRLNKVNVPIDKSLDIMYAYTATFIGMHFLFELLKYLTKKESDTKDEYGEDINLVEDELPPTHSSQKFLLGFHIIAMLSYATTLIVFIATG